MFRGARELLRRLRPSPARSLASLFFATASAPVRPGVQVRTTREPARMSRAESTWESVMEVTSSTSKTSVNDETLASETYARILPELEGLLLDELVSINLDIPSVVATTLGALPEIRALRPEIQEQLPRFDLASFNKLEDYAFTLHYAHAQYL